MMNLLYSLTCIHISTPQDIHKALKMLGLNPTEQEVVDIPNTVAR